jgi:hypothetical protein
MLKTVSKTYIPADAIMSLRILITQLFVQNMKEIDSDTSIPAQSSKFRLKAVNGELSGSNK